MTLNYWQRQLAATALDVLAYENRKAAAITPDTLQIEHSLRMARECDQLAQELRDYKEQ